MMNITDSNLPATRFTTAVMAGERPGASPVAAAADVCCKAMAAVAGQPMLQRVLRALDASEYVSDCTVVGLPKEAEQYFPGISILAGKQSPSASASYVLDCFAEQLPVLITTADHALLTAEMVDYFCEQAASSTADLVIAIAEIDTGDGTFSTLKRTLHRFQGHAYSGCNLFACMTRNARLVPAYWLQVEEKRKRPWQMIAQLGWRFVLAYLLGRLTLDEALAKLSSMLDVRIEAVVMPFPEAAIDVDTVADWHFVNRYLDTAAGQY